MGYLIILIVSFIVYVVGRLFPGLRENGKMYH